MAVVQQLQAQLVPRVEQPAVNAGKLRPVIIEDAKFVIGAVEDTVLQLEVGAGGFGKPLAQLVQQALGYLVFKVLKQTRRLFCCGRSGAGAGAAWPWPECYCQQGQQGQQQWCQ